MNVYLTLDYELFMGYRSGTPMKCLIEPMNALTQTGNKYGTKFVIFADAAYLYRLKQLSASNLKAKKDFSLVTKHLQALNANGHDIELHFHPQWLYSDYSDSGWRMDLSHYKLADLNESEVFDLFKESKNLLDDIIEKHTIAFRAGGFSLNSFQNYIKLFRENNIKIDSSVVRGSIANGKFQAYNYSNASPKSFYRFSDNVCSEDPNGIFAEYPITSLMMPGWKYLIKKKRLMSKFGCNKDKWGDGVGIGIHLSNKDYLISHMRKFIAGTVMVASIDTFLSAYLIELYKSLKEKGVKDMVIIGHPKLASPQSIKFLNIFLTQICEQDKITTFCIEKK